ncbi:hypothetical protein GT204_07760 [Streptomyces sp. SID4919]|uniref:hypothetical protein n=1 Tax=unclassified Streptomyces TaxID=2593676 RepID=UPI000823E41E|nr:MULTISPECIES: hypothetical protein [unclassified Streptomyces]MYY08801.1 hypothetical protein [Streptomyces sp. SID4919]SCK25360.1 hypothetical protein YW7DRAFT_01934 [Streptomyces sp. AmelKG-E11A]
MTTLDPHHVRDAVAREAALGALLDEVKAAYAAARTDVQAMLDQQHKATGTTKVDALLPDGTRVGSISRTGGESAAAVVDIDAFTAWVRDTYPSEHVVRVRPVEITTSVQPAFAAQILAQMTAAGAARIVDETTGEVHDVPGVAIKPSRSSSHRLTYTRKSKSSPQDGRALVAEAWRSGVLAPVVLPVLAPGGPAAETEGAA